MITSQVERFIILDICKILTLCGCYHINVFLERKKLDATPPAVEQNKRFPANSNVVRVIISFINIITTTTNLVIGEALYNCYYFLRTHLTERESD